MQCNFLTDNFDIDYSPFALNVQHRCNCSILDVEHLLEKLAEIFLFTFHRDKIFEKLTWLIVIAKEIV